MVDMRDKKPPPLKLARMREELAAVIETYQHPFGFNFTMTRNALEDHAKSLRRDASIGGKK